MTEGTAMKKISQIKIVSTDGMSDIQKYDVQLKTLILSIEGMIPGSRGFGLSREFVSKPPHEAINIFAIELEEKVEEFIPEITINNVEGKSNADGSLDLTIYVERR